MKETLGHPYALKVQRLMQQDLSACEDLQVKPEQAFFCSELLALLYKRLGILETSRPSHSYWPGCFSTEKGGITLAGDAMLSAEFTVNLYS